MDAPKIRKKTAIYGKTTKRLPMYDLFAFGHVDNGAPASGLKTRSTISRSNIIHLDDGKTPERLTRDTSSPSESSQRTSSPIEAGEGSANVDTSAVFEIASSDDDTRGSASSGLKRRKLMTAFGSALSDGEPSMGIETSLGSHVGKQTNRQRGLQTYRRTKPLPSHASRSKQQLRPKKSSKMREDNITSDSASPTGEDSPPISVKNEPTSGQASDNSTRSSPVAQVQTPKRRKFASTAGSDIGDIESPSQLGMRSLRLSPEPPKASNGEDLDEIAAFATQLTPRRGRQRLVDRLDAPPTQLDDSRSPSRRGSQEVTLKNRLKLSSARPPNLVKESSFDLKTTNDERSSERTESVNAHGNKSKRSYAQARSHLSDVTLEDSFRSVSSEGDAKQDLPLSQLDSQASLKSQLDAEESDDEDPSAGSKTKSIHELRRAGANNRFQREVEHIFEDIELKGSASRSLRLNALMQLLEKLNTPQFAIQFLDTQLEARLSSSASRELDVLSSLLFMACFFILSNVESTTNLSRKMQHAVVSISVTLLMEKRSVAALAKDRKNNLSKAAVRDLLACEEKLLAHSGWTGSALERLTPQLLSMSTLASMARRLRSEGQPFVNNSEAFLKEVLHVLNDSSSRLEGSTDGGENLLLVKSVVSFLENSSQSASALVHEDGRGLLSLTETLSKTLRVSGRLDTGLQQMTLRLVVNLSNNDSKLSSSIAETNILHEVSAIVEANFGPLARSVDAGEEIDATRLDSVILALGCLLSLVECSPEARDKMMHIAKSPISGTEWLLSTFNGRVDKSLSVCARLPHTCSDVLTAIRPPPLTRLKLWLPLGTYRFSSAISA